MSILSVRDLHAHYHVAGGTLRAVDGVSFDVEPGETLAIVGESGCGKSTLGKTLLRLVPSSGGRIVFDGADITTIGGAALRSVRRRMQMIFQDPYASLNPRHTIGQILEAPLKVHGIGPRAERLRRVQDILHKVGLPGATGSRYPHEFSGGQRQRIGIARALLLEPDLVVCDEPVSALDLSIQAQILNLLAGLKQERRLSYVFISHDLSVVRYFADRVLVMYLGRVVETADHDTLWRRPLHPYTQALIEAAPDPRKRRPAAPLAGELQSALQLPSGCRFHPRCPLATEQCRREEPVLAALTAGHQVACHHAGLDATGQPRRAAAAGSSQAVSEDA